MKTYIKTAVLTLITVLAIAGAASASSGWHVVAHRSASGGFAAAATSATVNHPHRIAISLTHGSGFVAWACSKGYTSISSWSRNYGAGFHELSHVYGKDSCDLTASVGGSGRVTVEILTRR